MPKDDIFYDLLPDYEQKYFEKRKSFSSSQKSQADAQKGLAKLLMSEFTMDDGETLSAKDILDMKAIGYCIANPSPQNVKALYDTAGLSMPNKVDLTSGGESIDSLLKGIATKDNG